MVTVTAECGEAEVDVVDADEPDSSAAADHENVHLKQLCSRLRKDLKHILLLSTADCQVLIASLPATSQRMRSLSSAAFIMH